MRTHCVEGRDYLVLWRKAADLCPTLIPGATFSASVLPFNYTNLFPFQGHPTPLRFMATSAGFPSVSCLLDSRKRSFREECRKTCYLPPGPELKNTISLGFRKIYSSHYFIIRKPVNNMPIPYKFLLLDVIWPLELFGIVSI